MKSTYSEEHPTAGKGHLLDGIRLVCESAVLLFQVFQRNRHVYGCAFEPLDLLETRETGIIWEVFNIDRPWLSQVG